MSDETTERAQTPEPSGAKPAAKPPAPSGGSAPAAAAGKHTGRIITARVLVVAATLLAVVSIFAAWANRQLLDTNQWTNTSTKLLENKAIRDEVAGYLVDELYANVDVSNELQSRLPGDLQPLAPIVAGGLRQLLDQVSKDALARPKVQALWEDANRAAHEQLVKVIDGGSGAVNTQGGVVTLDLRMLLTDIAAKLGLPGTVVSKIPAGAAQITVLKSTELEQAQNGAKLLRALGLWLGFVVILLYAIAVWLAVGRRRQTLLFSGMGLITAGLVAIVARGIAGGEVVNALAPSAGVQPAATAAWSIGTTLLQTLAEQAVIIGVGVIVAAWIAGPSRPATALRRAVAPVLGERPEVAYLVVAAAYLLLVVWAPIPALRRPLFLLILAVLLGLGVYVLRRQTDEEFPEASLAASGSGMRDAASRAGAALRRGGAAATGAAAGVAAKTRAGGDESAPTTPSGDPDADRLAKLERLVALRDGGALDDQEFAAEKAKLMGAPDEED